MITCAKIVSPGNFGMATGTHTSPVFAALQTHTLAVHVPRDAHSALMMNGHLPVATDASVATVPRATINMSIAVMRAPRVNIKTRLTDISNAAVQRVLLDDMQAARDPLSANHALQAGINRERGSTIVSHAPQGNTSGTLVLLRA